MKTNYIYIFLLQTHNVARSKKMNYKLHVSASTATDRSISSLIYRNAQKGSYTPTPDDQHAGGRHRAGRRSTSLRHWSADKGTKETLRRRPRVGPLPLTGGQQHPRTPQRQAISEGPHWTRLRVQVWVTRTGSHTRTRRARPAAPPQVRPPRGRGAGAAELRAALGGAMCSASELRGGGALGDNWDALAERAAAGAERGPRASPRRRPPEPREQVRGAGGAAGRGRAGPAGARESAVAAAPGLPRTWLPHSPSAPQGTGARDRCGGRRCAGGQRPVFQRASNRDSPRRVLRRNARDASVSF